MALQSLGGAAARSRNKESAGAETTAGYEKSDKNLRKI